MQVTAQQRSECEIELKIEVEAEKVAETLEQVYREFARKTEVPGFRKGKAPRQILERYVSPESVRRRAVDIMVPTAYRQALEQEKIEPYAEPSAEII
ncbi:MAG: trigger factor, partial [Armatimonadetes bacterium]|nr:trigger factor [Armatimonadota bacterium]NIT30115.1 trigger factor [Armatimonadota bacterium]